MTKETTNDAAVVDEESTTKSSDVVKQDDVEVTKDSGKEKTSSDDEHLTADALRTVEKYGNLSDEKKETLLSSLEESTRKWQRDAAKSIKEIYGVESLQPKESAIPKEMVESHNREQRRGIIEKWMELNNPKGDIKKILSNKTFLTHFQSDELANYDIKARTELALSRSYGTIDSQKRAKAELSVSNVSGQAPEEQESSLIKAVKAL